MHEWGIRKVQLLFLNKGVLNWLAKYSTAGMKNILCKVTKYIFFPTEFSSQKKAMNEEECFASCGKHCAYAFESVKAVLVFYSYGFYELLYSMVLSIAVNVLLILAYFPGNKLSSVEGHFYLCHCRSCNY